jgi:hypothetical protein
MNLMFAFSDANVFVPAVSTFFWHPVIAVAPNIIAKHKKAANILFVFIKILL